MIFAEALKPFDSIGTWEVFWWGSRWELSSTEVEPALAKIDVQRNSFAILGGVATAVSGVASLGGATPIIGGVTAALAAAYELMKSRIKAANRGNGVIVDFIGDYSGMESKIRFLFPSASSSPLTINNCMVRPR